MLSVAVTSFSIYLGIIEHSYSPLHTREYSLTTYKGHTTICLQYNAATSTTSTVIPGTAKVVQCGAQSS
jgi:hypothetical protein